MSTTLTGAEFKKQLRDGVPKLGIFVNSHSPTVIEQLAPDFQQRCALLEVFEIGEQ